VAREAKIEPPIHTEYFLSGGALILIFIVGGITYEEAAFVSTYNASNPSVNILLGGTCIHNSSRCVNFS